MKVLIDLLCGFSAVSRNKLLRNVTGMGTMVFSTQGLLIFKLNLPFWKSFTGKQDKDEFVWVCIHQVGNRIIHSKNPNIRLEENLVCSKSDCIVIQPHASSSSIFMYIPSARGVKQENCSFSYLSLFEKFRIRKITLSWYMHKERGACDDVWNIMRWIML